MPVSHRRGAVSPPGFKSQVNWDSPKSIASYIGWNTEPVDPSINEHLGHVSRCWQWKHSIKSSVGGSGRETLMMQCTSKLMTKLSRGDHSFRGLQADSFQGISTLRYIKILLRSRGVWLEWCQVCCASSFRQPICRPDKEGYLNLSYSPGHS